MPKAIPPRLFIIFATEAHEAVVFRRGPSSWFHVLRWNTRHDTFHSGAWIKARLYPERCDLSPNGELLLTFLHQGRKFRTDYKDSWNAISRAPWLHALGLWPQGTTYGGGGRFIDNRTAILRFYRVAPHPDHLGSGLKVNFASEYPRNPDPAPLHESTQEVGGAEWSGRDQRGRLIYTLNGKIMCLSDRRREAVCLADLNGFKPDPRPAPAAATEPLIEPSETSRRRRPMRDKRRPSRRESKRVVGDSDR
jgi:hypothetical protein